ncbi:MAG: hypothetical protein LC700_03940, partial [Actinobacteria bacterium]|nr:hypothetical protein [Actinomycetota bacterium]
MPRDFRIPTAAGGWTRADELSKRAQGRFEVRSAGAGLTGPRWYEWAMIDAGTPRHFLPLRRPLPAPGTPTADRDFAPTQTTTQTASATRGQSAHAPAVGTPHLRGTETDIPQGTSFVYCHAPTDSPIRPTLPNLVLMAGRRWPVQETIATGKGALGSRPQPVPDLDQPAPPHGPMRTGHAQPHRTPGTPREYFPRPLRHRSP